MKKTLLCVITVILVMLLMLFAVSCGEKEETDTFGLTVSEQLALARAAESDSEALSEISDEVQAETADSEEEFEDTDEADRESEVITDTTAVGTNEAETTEESLADENAEAETTEEETTVIETTEAVTTVEETTAVTSAAATEKVTEAETSLPQATITYVLNTNSKKFHDPGCSSVKKMKEKNRSDFTGTRAEAIAMGYEPCGSCHP